MKRLSAALLALLLALTLLVGDLATPMLTGWTLSSAQADTLLTARSKKNKATPTPKPTKTPRPTETVAPTEAPAATPAPTPEGPITEPQAIADYLFTYGQLPDNFITKKEAQALGWDSTRNYVSDVAPGKCIGGDRFGNYEGILPTAKGRQYYECDCYYIKGKRNAYRIIFSNDGSVYYTADHYQTFTPVYPSEGIEPVTTFIGGPRTN